MPKHSYLLISTIILHFCITGRQLVSAHVANYGSGGNGGLCGTSREMAKLHEPLAKAGNAEKAAKKRHKAISLDRCHLGGGWDQFL